MCLKMINSLFLDTTSSSHSLFEVVRIFHKCVCKQIQQGLMWVKLLLTILIKSFAIATISPNWKLILKQNNFNVIFTDLWEMRIKIKLFDYKQSWCKAAALFILYCLLGVIKRTPIRYNTRFIYKNSSTTKY